MCNGAAGLVVPIPSLAVEAVNLAASLAPATLKIKSFRYKKPFLLL